MPALDLYDRAWPIWTYAELNAPAKFVHDVEGRRGFAVTSLVSGGCIVSGSTLRRSLLFNNVRVNSFSTIEEAVILPNVEIGRNVRLNKVVIDRGVHIPEGLVVGEDPDRGRKAIPPHRIRHLPDHAVHDQRADRSEMTKVLAVASEVFPLVKTGGLADVVGALPGALKNHGIDMRVLVPGYPAVIGGLEGTGSRLHSIKDLFGGPARVLAGKAAEPRSSRSRRAASLQPAGQSVSRSRRPGLARQLEAVRARSASSPTTSAAAQCPRSCRTSSMLTIGRQRSLPFISAPAPQTRTKVIVTVHNLAFQGNFPAHDFRRPPLARKGFRHRRRRVLRRRRAISRAGCNLPMRSPPSARPTPRKSARPAGGMGLDGLLRARHGVLSGIVNGIDTDVWNPETDTNIAATYTAAKIVGARRQQAAGREAIRSGGRRRS